MSTTVKLARVPRTIHTREELLGVVAQLEDVRTLMVLVEDQDGVWVMQIDGTTAERMNWMLDRAKRLLHD